MNRLWGFTLTIISAICVYVSVSCYYKITEYDAKLVSLNMILNQQSDISNTLSAEDLIILQKIDQQNKRIKEQDEQIRIQNILINEARAKSKRK